jgi:hypothetical protein
MSWLEDFDSRLSEVLAKYSPDQPRDENGQFASVDGGSSQYKPIDDNELIRAGHLRLSNLSEEEKSALYSYVQNGFTDMNYALRNPNYSVSQDEDEEEIIKDNVNTLIGLIDRNEPLPTDSLLYRGVHSGSRWEGLQVGDRFVEKGFSSTSSDLRTAKDFGSKIMEIQAPAGTKALETSLATNYGVREKEVILQAGTEFEVVSNEKNGVIKLRVVNG